MGCLQRLGQPQRRGDFTVAGWDADKHAADGHNTGAAALAIEEAEEEEKQWLVASFQAFP